MLVSVIIPCFNQGRFLNDALESVYNQTEPDWECIIVDDGSTDNTKIISKQWESRDKRFKYFYKKNGGVSSARNFGLGISKGDYIQFLDCDDVLDSLKFKLSLSELSHPKNKEVKMVISNFKTLSEDGIQKLPPFCELKKESIKLDNFLYNFFSIQLQCGFFHSSLFKEIRFPEELSAQEDWVVWLKILKNKPNYIFIDIPLAYYRINPESRMRTIGAGDNQIKVLSTLKDVLNYDEYHKFSKAIISKYFSSMELYKKNLNTLKKSRTYKISFILKKVLNKLKILKD